MTFYSPILFRLLGQSAAIGGQSQRWFVAAKDPNAQTLTVVGSDHPMLFSRNIRLRRDNFSWVAESEQFLPELDLDDKERSVMRGFCRVRHQGALIPCKVLIPDPASEYFDVALDRPERAVAEGQVLALHSGRNKEEVLGGGVIHSVERHRMQRAK